MLDSEEYYVFMLREFIPAFGAKLDPRFWLTLIEEETKELDAALESEPSSNILKELCDVLYVTSGLVLTCPLELDDLLPKEEYDAMLRTLALTTTLVEEAASLFTEEVIKEAFLRVHQSNMSKLGDDGQPVRREDGKVLKGPNYVAPELGDLV